MRKLATLDIETDPFKHGRYPAPFMCDIFDGDEHFTFYGEDSLHHAVSFLYDKPWRVYAHNGGKFDYHFMLDWLENWQKIKIISGRISQFNVGECEFRDSWNILPVPLSAYAKEEIDYDKMEAWCREEHHDEILAYLHKDTEYLHEIVQTFIDEYGCKLTLAGAAFSFWKTNFIDKNSNDGKEALKKTDKEYYEKFKRFYFGGRVECFEKGILEGEFESFDIKSAYPFAMTSEHPTGTAIFETVNAKVERVIEEIDSMEQAFFDVHAISTGALPFRHDDGSTSYPRDSKVRRYSCTGWELKAALDTSSITLITVDRILQHSSHINFDEYVSHFFALKTESEVVGDKARRLIAKIFLNALYGKFAADPEKYHDYIVGDIHTYFNAIEKYGYEFNGTLGGNILMKRGIAEHEKNYYNVATAASITGFVRAYLWRHIHASKRPIYCDTDAIFAEKFNGKVGIMLGDWEKEGEYCRIAVAGKKLYAAMYGKNYAKREGKEHQFKYASKGARLTPAQIFNVASGWTVEYNSEAPSYSVFNVPTFTKRKVKMT